MTENQQEQKQAPDNDAGTMTAAETVTGRPMFSEDTLNLIRILICFVLVFPAIQLYFTIPSAISMWVAEQYVPFFNMLYFTAIILFGIWLLRYTSTLPVSKKIK
jgi:hypothetical protein